MSRVAIFTDSASDMDPADAEAEGITIIPLLVSFGPGDLQGRLRTVGRGVLGADGRARCAVPHHGGLVTGRVQGGLRGRLRRGDRGDRLDPCGGSLSGTIKSAQIARDMLPDREIHVVDSLGASMAQGILARMGVEMAADDRPAAEIAETLEGRAPDMRMYVALETLEYLKKGGRISGAQAAIGTLLSLKPIIAVEHGVVEQADRVRTRAKARDRVIELICQRPIERLAILHTVTPDVEGFRDEVLAKASGELDAADVSINLVGASVGPHLGPGCVGAAVLYRP